MTHCAKFRTPAPLITELKTLLIFTFIIFSPGNHRLNGIVRVLFNLLLNGKSVGWRKQNICPRISICVSSLWLHQFIQNRFHTFYLSIFSPWIAKPTGSCHKNKTLKSYSFSSLFSFTFFVEITAVALFLDE